MRRPAHSKRRTFQKSYETSAPDRRMHNNLSCGTPVPQSSCLKCGRLPHIQNNLSDSGYPQRTASLGRCNNITSSLGLWL